MTHATDSNPSDSKQEKNHPRRRLDHLTDLSDGFDQWDMIPRKLTRAFIDKKFDDRKFRLLLCMMSHSGGFHVKRKYLEERFKDDVLKRFLNELVIEGYIRLESVPAQRGGYMNLYHVRPLTDWELYRQPVDPPESGVSANLSIPPNPGPREGGDHKDFNLKDFNSELDPHTHTAPKGVNKTEQPPKNKEKPKNQAEDLAEKFGNELHKYGVIIDLKLMAMNIGLVSQNLGKSWEWMDQTFGEAVAYLCGRRNYVAMDVGHDYFKWCKNYRDIPKPQPGNSRKKATGSGTSKVSKFDPQAELAKLVESQND